MQEYFLEESALVQQEGPAKRKYTLIKVFSIISYVCAIIMVILFFNFYSLENFHFLGFFIQVLLPFGMFLATGILLGRYKNKLYVDYDYTLVSGSLRISKVINKSKRRGFMKFDITSILQLGKYGSGTYEKISKSPNVKTFILTSNVNPSEGKDFFYLHVSHGDGQRLLVFECTETFMATILRYSNRTILEKDYNKKWYILIMRQQQNRQSMP